MSTPPLLIIASTAFTLGLVHTLIGIDHYLPFIVLAKANKWSLPKTLLVTFLCGIGHVLSSIVIGLIGIALGVALSYLEGIETVRGDIAAWGLLLFGLIYGTLGLIQGIRNKSQGHVHYGAISHIYESGPNHQHIHPHPHSEESHDHATESQLESIHDHPHNHHDPHTHNHIHQSSIPLEPSISQNISPSKSIESNQSYITPITNPTMSHKSTITIWTIFLIFVFGPCEPLIPLVMTPAIYYDWWGIVFVSTVFGLTTILTMLILVALISYGLIKLNISILDRFVHAISGYVIALSGFAIIFLGL
jgi:nickel/cobalt exporter